MSCEGVSASHPSATRRRAAPRTVVMIAYWFPPCVRWPSSGERVRGLASWLPEHGWHPIVVTPRLDREDLCECPVCTGQVAPPPIDDDGYEVHRLRVSPKLRYRLWRLVKGSTPPTTEVSGTVRPSLASRLSFVKGATETRAAWLRPVRSYVAELARTREVDVIWTTSGPYESIRLGRRLQRALDVPWVADLRDPVSETIEPDAIRMAAKRRHRARMRRRLQRADAVVGATSASSERDARWLGRNVRTILSGFDPGRWKGVRPRRHATDELAVVYAGAIYPDDLDLDLLFRSWRMLDDGDGLRIRLHYYGPHGPALLAAAARHGVERLVEDHGTVSAEDARGLMTGADVLLLLEYAHARSLTRTPGKLYEYLAARRPVLALPDVSPAIREILTTTGAGTAASSPDAIAQYLQELAGERRRVGHGHVPYTGDTDAVARFSIANSAAQLADLLADLGPEPVR